jgi:hypothetical protein
MSADIDRHHHLTPPFSRCFPAVFPTVFPLQFRGFPAAISRFSCCNFSVFPPISLPESVQSAVYTWFLSQQASSSLHLKNGTINRLNYNEQYKVKPLEACRFHHSTHHASLPLSSRKAEYDVDKGRPSSLGFSCHLPVFGDTCLSIISRHTLKTALEILILFQSSLSYLNLCFY